MSEASAETTAAVMIKRKEKVKFSLKGKDVVEVIWSRQIRIAFLCHLVLRGLIEVCFLCIGYYLQGEFLKTINRFNSGNSEISYPDEFYSNLNS